MGRDNTISSPSIFASEMITTKAAIEAQFPDRAAGGGWNDAGGIPVRVTGVGFFDRPHGQTDRATNGIELHPILKIEFNPAPGGLQPAAPAPPIATTFTNPGFEEGKDQWTASDGVISDDTREPARSGTFKAWLGGYGEPHTDNLCREITIPPSVTTASISFFLHISTEEQASAALDSLKVLIRKPSGAIVQTLATFSNLQAKPGFQLHTYDLSAFKGQTVNFCLTSKEDAGSVTSLVADDFSFVSR